MEEISPDDVSNDEIRLSSRLSRSNEIDRRILAFLEASGEGGGEGRRLLIASFVFRFGFCVRACLRIAPVGGLMLKLRVVVPVVSTSSNPNQKACRL